MAICKTSEARLLKIVKRMNCPWLWLFIMALGILRSEMKCKPMFDPKSCGHLLDSLLMFDQRGMRW